jgi:hypothetical protein
VELHDERKVRVAGGRQGDVDVEGHAVERLDLGALTEADALLLGA